METTERLIYIDDLTGLYNRRYLYSHLPKELQAAQINNYSLWLFMLDVDNFKTINDTYGHLFGDEMIKEIAELIKQNTKTDDKKIRYAGDEFTIILPNLEAKNVAAVGQRLLARINTHVFKEKRTGKAINITMSLGAAGYPQDSSESIDLINLADKALYVSKQKGKNCVSTVSEITPELFWKKDLLDRFPCSVLVERDSELSRLKDILHKTLSPKTHLLLISGGLGVGKTRLLSEFEDIVAGSRRAVCLDSHSQEKFINQPYHMVGDALYKYFSSLDKLPEGILDDFVDAEIEALCEFMPVLRDVPGFPAVGELAAQKTDSLLPALIKLLQNIPRIKPLCLFFDDFHYIDQRSLEMLLSLIQQNKELPLFIIATYSTQELAVPEVASSAFGSVVNTELFQELSQHLSLSALSREGVSNMIANIFPAVGFAGGFVDLVYKVTKGNPLFVQELLKYLIDKEYIVYEAGKLFQKPIGENELPVTIEEAIRKRIDSLSPETKGMIAKAAAIGDEFQVDLLRKIDSEDKGYVLDLVEAAKRIGLISESGGVGRDEFSFVTGEIRKVFSKLIDENQQKQLHSRLGEIKESLHADNLSSIAGELYYNFKKAEDWVRAEQYAKLIKEGRATFRDRTARYAEALLGEAEEAKKISTLSKNAMAVMPQIIRYNYIASVNCVLYPKASRMRLQPVEEIHKRLSQIFAETDVLNIASFQDALIVNNKKLGKEQKSFFSEGFISLLKNLGIESISFEKDVKLEELSKFIEIINDPKKEGELSLRLEKSGVSHIKVNEVSYDITKRKTKEKEGLQEMMFMDYLLGKLPLDGKPADLNQDLSAHAQEIAQTLEKLGEQASKESGRDKEVVKAEMMAKSLQKLGSQFAKEGKGDWGKYKESLAKTLLSMEPGLRANVLAHSSESPAVPIEEDKGKEGLDVIKELGYDIPDEAIIDVLASQYLERDTDFKKMQRLVKRFLATAEKKKRLGPVLREKFMELGAGKEECDWILEEDTWNRLSWEEKADKIITLPAKNLLRLLSMVDLSALIEELLAGGKDVLVEAVVEKLFSLLGKEFPQREQLAGYFSQILDVFIRESTQKLFLKFLKRLAEISSSIEEFFFSVINPYLHKVIEILLKEERFALIKKVMQFYTKDADTLERFLKILEPIASRLIEEFIRRIDANLDWQEVTDILVLFKTKIALALIEEALFEKGVESGRYFEAYLRRFNIGKVLSRLPQDELLVLFKEKLSHPEPYIVRNLIEVIRVMENDAMTNILEIPLKHKEAFIRRKTIFALSKLKGEASTKLLAEALKDTEASLRKYALSILKNRKDEASIKILNQQGDARL